MTCAWKDRQTDRVISFCWGIIKTTIPPCMVWVNNLLQICLFVKGITFYVVFFLYEQNNFVSARTVMVHQCEIQCTSYTKYTAKHKAKSIIQFCFSTNVPDQIITVLKYIFDYLLLSLTLIKSTGTNYFTYIMLLLTPFITWSQQNILIFLTHG